MKRLPLFLTVVALVAAIAAIPAFGATKTVKVGDNFFSPGTVTVSKGSTVKFRWTGDNPHNVTASGKSAFKRIGTRESGTISRKANKKGTFRLVCTIHDGMSMKLKVK